MQNYSGEFSLPSKVSCFSNSSLNPLNSLPQKYITRVRKDIEEYSGVSSRCKGIWNTIMKIEIVRFPFGVNTIQKLFKQHQQDISRLTKISSMDELMSTFDVDQDKCLNQDELISIFTFIKNKIEGTANDAIQIQAYSAFKDLIKQVRTLQGFISQWQDILRMRIYKDQLNQYKQIGDVKIDEFCQKYEGLFERLQSTKEDRRWQLQRKFQFEQQKLQQKLSNPANLAKIKPSNRLKELQLREKLVCIEQRVDEALNYRTQLNKLEMIQQNRVNSLVQSTSSNQRNNLREKHEKERQQLEIKLEQLVSKLKIQMQKQYNVLLKRNKLHQNQIKKIQAVARKVGIKKGVQEPELHRSKQAQDLKNSLIANFRRSKDTAGRLLTELSDVSHLKSHQTIQDSYFNLNEKEARSMSKGNRVKTVHKYLQTGGKEKVFPLCNLYNKSLVQMNNPQRRLSTRMSTIDNCKRKIILQKINLEA